MSGSESITGPLGDIIQWKKTSGDLLLHYLDSKKIIANWMLSIPEKSAFLDVGSYSGDTVVPMAVHAKNNGREDIRFFAIDPFAGHVEFIQDVARCNEVLVSTYCCAVGDKERNVAVSPDRELHLPSCVYQESDDVEDIFPMTTLDILMPEFGQVGLLHIDANTWDCRVLQGADALVTRDSPVVIAEVARVSDLEKIREVMSKHVLAGRLEQRPNLPGVHEDVVYFPSSR